jgi:hypothetical protein
MRDIMISIEKVSEKLRYVDSETKLRMLNNFDQRAKEILNTILVLEQNQGASLDYVPRSLRAGEIEIRVSQLNESLININEIRALIRNSMIVD